MGQPERPEGELFAELLATPGVEEIVELRSTFGFMAFHGGSLEKRTDVIASMAAAASGASYYAVLQPSHLRATDHRSGAGEHPGSRNHPPRQ